MTSCRYDADGGDVDMDEVFQEVRHVNLVLTPVLLCA